MKYIELLESFGDKPIIAFHRSKDLKHMEDADFDLSKSDDEFSIFGQAIYFGSSGNMLDSEFGDYLCKFEIKMDKPILDMNKSMSIDDANKLLAEFNKKYGTKIKYYDKDSSEDVTTYDFGDNYDGKVQYGEFFLELQDILHPQPNKHYKDFIQSLGYNSFMHYATYGSDFITTKGDYGRVYGIYNNKNIKFVDGPF